MTGIELYFRPLGERTMTSVSVVIPCYNYGHFLKDAVASVLDNQNGVDVRVLIIDDASPDGSADVAREIATCEPRIDVVVHAKNRGNIATFNEGLLEWADGDYTVLMSADDRLTPGALQRATRLLDSNRRVGFVYGHAMWTVEGAREAQARTSLRGWSIWPGHRWLEHRFRQAENPIISPELVVRTSLQKRVGGYDSTLPRAADMEMYMRLAANGDVGFLRGVDQAYYRVHGKNMSEAVSPLMDLQQRRDVFEVVLERYGDKLHEVDYLSEVVHRVLGREALWAAARAYDRGPIRRTELARRLLGVAADEREEDITDLLTFALGCWPEIVKSPLYRTLEMRGGMGAGAIQYMLAHKAKWWLRRRAWKHRGY